MYKTSIASDFFNEKGLEARTGLTFKSWEFAIFKELTDNALDSIETKDPKQIDIILTQNNFKIFDNGDGISVDSVKQIYDFENYISKNRHIIRASRGKQGNGLKSIIGMLYLKDYKLLWHTADGVILQAIFNAEQIADEKMEVLFEESGNTDKRGIEIVGINYSNRILEEIIQQYSLCNPDVTFNFESDLITKLFKATTQAVNKAEETSIEFYSFNDFKRLISVQQPIDTYKSFLKKYFGIRTSNESKLKVKLCELKSDEAIKDDFDNLKNILKNKPYTILRKHLLGFDNQFEVSITEKSNQKGNNSFPCLCEYSVNKLDTEQAQTIIHCFINNSISYFDGSSITFDSGFYKICSTRKPVFANDLRDLLKDYTDYEFDFHIIAPYLNFKDFGKTQVNISDFIDILVAELKKTLAKEKKKEIDNAGKKEKQNIIAKKYMTTAFLQASSNGKYAITARQMYYKLRELVGREQLDWETDNTYRRFTQDWLTEWIENNDEFESKVNFSERGNFYVDGSQTGLGSANVRIFLDNIGSKSDTFTLDGGIDDNIYRHDDFNIRYRYDKALYIEKTGFDAIFRAEHIDEKYHVLIVSGQGFASREARKLLYNLQQQGLKLFCMHDLDTQGANIFTSMCKANDKFKSDLNMVDLGVTPQLVEKYNIVPEQIDRISAKTIASLDYKYRTFFYNNGADTSPRVELSAFTTEQILEILDDAFKNECNLPMVNLSQSLQLDNQVLREVAFMRILKDKYKSQLDNIDIPCDLSGYDGKYTMDEAKQAIPEIQEQLIKQYQHEIMKKIAI